MDLTEVTAADYAACVGASRCTATGLSGSNATYKDAAKAKHPINYVDFYQATVYCTWKDKRLPTEPEWEYAARGSDGRRFPWGPEAPGTADKRLCWSSQEPCPVGSHPEGRSQAGVADLAGNVWEWTQSDLCDYPAHDCVVRTRRVLRGGSWLDKDVDTVQTTWRGYASPDRHDKTFGFRCARDGEAR
jgi:formylglycine-generating enzyme required for sulfatase activity